MKIIVVVIVFPWLAVNSLLRMSEDVYAILASDAPQSTGITVTANTCQTSKYDYDYYYTAH